MVRLMVEDGPSPPGKTKCDGDLGSQGSRRNIDTSEEEPWNSLKILPR